MAGQEHRTQRFGLLEAGWRLLAIRPRDRRDSLIVFFTLLLMMAGHALLETARDTLFLQRLSSDRLPLAYLAIAILALAVGTINRKLLDRFGRRFVLSVTLFVGAGVTLLFGFVTDPSPWLLGALYVWVGLFATLAVVQFWLRAGDVFDVGQAKRVFGFAAAGGVLGATIGSAGAGALLFVGEPRHLIVAAAILFFVAAGVPLSLRQESTQEESAKESTRSLVKDPYLSRLFLLVLISSLLVTGVDLVFKATASQTVPAEELGFFFARFYTGLNAVSLLVQLVLAPRLLHALGVHRALLVLPTLLLLGAGGFAALGGLVPVLLLKGADGTLRHSLNRISSEILFLPLGNAVRARFRSFAEALGHRGGQALASLLALLAVWAGLSSVTLGLALAGLSLAWVLFARSLEPHYLEQFRRHLRHGAPDHHLGVAALDLNSLEVLVSALSAQNDHEVIAALDMFESYGKTKLVPALILYHPSQAVVLRGLELFYESNRHDVIRVAERLLSHADDEIRAAALRMVSSVHPDEDRIRSFTLDASPVVRSEAYAALYQHGLIADEEAEQELKRLVSGEENIGWMAAARSLRHLPADRFGWIATSLADHRDPALCAELGRSMAAAPDEQYIPVLLRMLAHREARSLAREALLQLGDKALDALEAGLQDESLSRKVTRHLPRTIARFKGERPVRILTEQLERDPEERVVYKILRGLGSMVSQQRVVDREAILRTIDRSLKRAITLLHQRLAFQEVLGEKKRTPSAELILTLLKEKEDLSLEMIFRLLHILKPSEAFRMIYNGLQSADKKSRASSRELLSHLVPPRLRETILAMVDDLSDAERLDAAKTFYQPAFSKAMKSDEAYRAILESMLDHPSNTLRSLARFHMIEVGVEPPEQGPPYEDFLPSEELPRAQ